MAPQFVEPGDILLSKYQVERVLGKGGMGFVVVVRTVDFGDRYAIKLLLPAAIDGADSERRFLREARICMRLTGEHAVRVHDVGRLDDGSLYMRMEYLEGMDLKAYLAVKRSLSITEAITYVVQAAEGIDEAHALGIIHRDIKPANIFLTQPHDGTPCIKVLDFGISKQPTHEVSGRLTETGMMLGSPLYMSPEQMMQASEVDRRTDIWSMGVMLYEFLVGTPPFHGETFTKIVHQVLNTEPKPMRQLCPQLPVALDRVVMRCLEKDPEKRFVDMKELMAALRTIPGVTQLATSSHTSVDAFADTHVIRCT